MSSKRLTTTQRSLLKIQKELTTYYTQKIVEFTQPNAFLKKEIIRQKSYFNKALLRKISFSDLQKAFSEHHIIIVGDYHPFKPSQNEFFDLIQATHAQGTSCAVILESLNVVDQRVLNQFMEGLITSGEYLEETHFEKYWGFPSYSTEKMMHYCRREKIPLYGMNSHYPSTSQNSQTSFRKREQQFFKTIKSVSKEHPQKKIFVLLGNLHLMPHHLPSHWPKKAKNRILYIHQDIDEIYWKKAANLPHIHRECYKESAHRLVVLNAHPWIKYHSYWTQIERAIEYEQQTREESLEDLLLDQHEQFVHLFHKVSDVLGYKLTPPEFAVYGPLDLSLPLLLKKAKKISQKEKVFYLSRFKSEMAFYFPEAEILFCPQMNINIMIDCIAQMIVFKHHQWHFHFRGDLADFYSWIILEAQFFFIAKLLNSSRKPPSFTKLFKGKAKHLFGKGFQPALEKVLNSKSQNNWKSIETIFKILPPEKKYQLVRWLGRNWGTEWFNQHNKLGNKKILTFLPSKTPHQREPAMAQFKKLIKQVPFLF